MHEIRHVRGMLEVQTYLSSGDGAASEVLRLLDVATGSRFRGLDVRGALSCGCVGLMAEVLL